MNTIIKLLIAVIKMPTKIGDRIIRLQQTVTKLTNNTYFPTGWVAGTLTQAQFGLDVTAYINQVTNVKNHVAGAVGLRNAAWTTLKADMQLILAMVQSKANANETIAEAIIGSVGFFVRTGSGKQKKQNGAYNTEVLGTVALTSDGTGPHEWEMSKDMVTIINLPATTTAQTQVTGLNTGDVWYFRMRKVNGKKKTYNWCNWIMLKVGAGGKNLGGGGDTHSTAGDLPTA
jgi:hypothetical protein